MNNIFVFFLGSLIGLAAALLFNARGRKDLGLFAVIGAVGALIGGNLLAPHFGVAVSDRNLLTAGSVWVAAAGSVLLLLVVSPFRGHFAPVH